MKRLLLLVGIPGSGKTTLAEKLIEKGYHCLNADSIRRELYGDAAAQGDPEQVFAIFFKQLEEALKAEKAIVIDNTNANPKQRKPILDMAKANGYDDIQIWLMDVPLEVCLKRNQGRDRVVSDDIVRNMYKTVFGPGRPQRSEGKIVLVRPGANIGEFNFITQ